jgi:lactoylglutathione lyase
MNFTYTILYVKDVSKSIEFYEKAFGFKRKFIAPGDGYGELDTGSVILAFASHGQAASNLPEGFTESSIKEKPFGFEIGFTTNDVDAAYDKAVKAGAIEVVKAKTKPWGQVVAYVKDLDGFLVEICTPMA